MHPKGHAGLERFLSQLEEEIFTVDLDEPSQSNLSAGEWTALRNLDSDRTIVAKGADKDLLVFVCQWANTYLKLKNILMINGYIKKLNLIKTFRQVWLKRVIRFLIICVAIEIYQQVSSSILPTILKKQPALGSFTFYPKYRKG